MGTKRTDPVRDMIRASVQHHMLPPGEAPPLLPIPEGVESVESRKVDEQTILIKVNMTVGGPRYFNVKTSEQW